MNNYNHYTYGSVDQIISYLQDVVVDRDKKINTLETEVKILKNQLNDNVVKLKFKESV
jgi:hypothetical protein